VRKILVIALTAFIFSACATTGKEAKLAKYTPVQESLTYLTQKVEGVYGKEQITKDFNSTQYMNALTDVCYIFPSCKARVDELLKNYELSARGVIGGVFSVMLCEKNSQNKAMEDFSCNNSLVEVRSWEKDVPEECNFENRWEDVIKTYCRN